MFTDRSRGSLPGWPPAGLVAPIDLAGLETHHAFLQTCATLRPLVRTVQAGENGLLAVASPVWLISQAHGWGTSCLSPRSLKPLARYEAGGISPTSASADAIGL